MMSGKFVEFNWRDVERLIFKEVGLKTPADMRTKGEMWFITSGFQPPEHVKDTIIRVQVYDKDFSSRLEEHCKDD